MKKTTLVLAIVNTSVMVAVDINVEPTENGMTEALNIIQPRCEDTGFQIVAMHPPGQNCAKHQGRTFKAVSPEADGFKFTVHAEDVGIGGDELHRIGELIYQLFMPDDYQMPEFTVKRVVKSPAEHGIHPL